MAARLPPRVNSGTTEDDLLRRRKTPPAQVRQRLAPWVRELGVTDPEVAPNHGWRHTFKAVGRRARISDKVLDDICGHAAASIGQEYRLRGGAERMILLGQYTA